VHHAVHGGDADIAEMNGRVVDVPGADVVADRRVVDIFGDVLAALEHLAGAD
jgi:hypothetical protein